MITTQTITVGKWRWPVYALLFFATTINNMDRQIFRVLVPTLQLAIGWMETGYARVIAGYAGCRA